MKANIQLEFSDDEIKDFAASAIVRTVSKMFKDEPQAAGVLQNLVGQIMNTTSPPRAGRAGPPPGWAPMPPPGYGCGCGPTPPPPQQARVVPINPEMVHNKCFAIEETRQQEAGIGCHVCATFNAAGRDKCRYCGHVLCCDISGPIITPPPQ